MENRVENPGLNIDRGRVDSFKKVIKEKEVFKLEGSDKDLAAIGVIGELGINGVNTTEDLFNKTQNGNVNQEVARKNIKDLGTAIAESILESDNEELKAAMVAGSYSTEALLPEPWRGRMESDAGDVGLAGVICDALTEKISDKAKKETVQRAMETVDFFKNNSEYNNLLPDQLDASITELRGLINPLNRNEMKVISERLKYLQDEKEKTSNKNQKGVFGQEKDRTDKDRRLAQIERAEAMKNQEEASENGTEGEKRKGSFYMMEPEDLINLEMTQRAKDQFHFSPPYPEWFKDLAPDEQKLWMIRVKLINGVAYKQALRNVDAEKLMANRALDLNTGEFKILCEKMEGFQEAAQTFVKDLFEWEKETPNGERYLKLKQRELTQEEVDGGKVGRVIIKDVEDKLTHFEAYKEKMALKMEYPSLSDEEINQKYLNDERASDKFRGAVGVAWNFLYIGNIIESADIDRQLKPTEVVSDKIRTMLHPLQKALGKWGVFKGGKEIIMGISGEEEPMGGDIASWVKYQLEMDEINGNNNFRNKLLKGEINPFPRRTACSLMEMMMVETESGSKTMAEALMLKEKIIFDKSDKDSDLDIFTEFRDTMDGCKTAYTYLTGGAKLEAKKNLNEWARKFNADIALIRQMNSEREKALKKGKPARANALSFVNDPEFMKWVIAASTGFDHRLEKIVLNSNAIGSNGMDYYWCVSNIVDAPGLSDLRTFDRVKLMESLSAVGDRNSGPFKTNLLLRSLRKEINKQEDKRDNEIRRRHKKGIWEK